VEDFTTEFPKNMTDLELTGISSSVLDLIKLIGEDPNREGLQNTPRRFAKALSYLTSGYKTDPKAILNDAIFHEAYDEMIVVKNIEVYSLCEHHMLPFFGHVHIAYIPNGKIVGLSKIPRMIDVFARRLQVQERLTTDIANTLQELLQPRGVGVVLEASHLCMMMRGVEKQSASMITSSMLGDFRTNEATRKEFLSLIKASR
jgi:GTP cyclohydrolase I